MKTKDLIALLQQNDPTGELEVTVGNEPILTVGCYPHYYDGLQKIMYRDGSGISKGRFSTEGLKLKIITYGFSDAIYDDPQFEIDYSSVKNDRTRELYKEYYELLKKKSLEVDRDIYFETFLTFVSFKAGMPLSLEQIETAKKFFIEYVWQDEGLDPGIKILSEKYPEIFKDINGYDRRIFYFLYNYSVIFLDNSLELFQNDVDEFSDYDRLKKANQGLQEYKCYQQK